MLRVLSVFIRLLMELYITDKCDHCLVRVVEWRYDHSECCNIEAGGDLAMGDMGSRQGRHLAGGGTRRPLKKVQSISLICRSHK